MFNGNLFKLNWIKATINGLNQALQHLYEHNYTSAQIRVALAQPMLEELQLDFNLHFQAEEMLEQLLKQSLK
jgi:hypothetical protein